MKKKVSDGMDRYNTVPSTFRLFRGSISSKKMRQVEVKQRDHSTLRGEVSATTLHMEQKQERERLARERVETLEVGRRVCVCVRMCGVIPRSGYHSLSAWVRE